MFIDRLEKTACVNEELILIDTRLAVLKIWSHGKSGNH